MEIKGWYYAVSWIVAFVGWIVVNQQNNRREERKEIRNALGEIEKALASLVEASIAYHKSDKHSPDAANKIRIQIQKVGLKVSHLHFYSERVNQSIYELRQAITYKNFDSWQHTAQGDDSELIEEIHSASDQLLDELEREFGKLFRQGFKMAAAQEIRRFKGLLNG